MSEKEIRESPAAVEYAVDADITDESLRQRLLKVLQAEEKPKKMTYEAFLAWADEDTLAEWVSGDVIMTSPASKRHQEISIFLSSILQVHVEAHQIGQILAAPFQMKVGDSGREPDLLFIAQANIKRLKKTYLDGPADLVVEIISPESATRDRGAKFYEYEAAGIPEYWLIDPQREQVEFYQLDAQGHYQLVRPDDDGVYTSDVLVGLHLPVVWLWNPPAVIAALKSLALIE